MWYSRYIILVISSTFVYFSFISCVSDKKPDQSANGTYETVYGTVTQIDKTPFYSLTYELDYHFDAYLNTGTFPSIITYNSGFEEYGCTCFSMSGSDTRLFGRNFDWNESAAYFILFTNPPDGYSSVSTVDLVFFDYIVNKPPDYIDNLDVLQILPYFPFDGMNEKGVAIGMNALPYSNPPNDPSKVTIGELQLIRLVLDYAGSTTEAITLIRQYNIQMEDPPIHYLIADTSGHSVIIEFMNGEMEIIENSEPYQVTTNFVLTGLDDPMDANCWRYRLASEELEEQNGIHSENEAFALLEKVSVPTTRWSIVFNLRTGQLEIAMGRNYQNRYPFSLTK